MHSGGCNQNGNTNINTQQITPNNLQVISNTRTKEIGNTYFVIDDQVFLFSPVLSKQKPKSFKEFWTEWCNIEK